MSERPLRVAYLVYRGNPHCGGQGVYTRALAHELTQLGHEITVLSGPPYPDLVEPEQLWKVPGLDLYRARQDGLGFARAAVELGVTIGMGSGMRLASVWEEALDLLDAADEVIEAELILKDLDTLEKKADGVQRKSKTGDPKAKAEAEFYN